jgi:hypothetical protein
MGHEPAPFLSSVLPPSEGTLSRWPRLHSVLIRTGPACWVMTHSYSVLPIRKACTPAVGTLIGRWWWWQSSFRSQSNQNLPLNQASNHKILSTWCSEETETWICPSVSKSGNDCNGAPIDSHHDISDFSMPTELSIECECSYEYWGSIRLVS